MDIGTVLTNKNVSKLLLQIIKTINDEQSNNWFIINDEIYQRNAPYDVTGVYTPELIEDLFDFDNLLIVSGVFYATQISITQEKVIERLQRISAIETTNKEIIIYVCDNTWIEVYTKDSLLLSSIVKACKGLYTEMEMISLSNCQRNCWYLA